MPSSSENCRLDPPTFHKLIWTFLTWSLMSVVSLRMIVSSTMWSVPSRGLRASRVGHCSRASDASRMPRQGSGRGGPDWIDRVSHGVRFHVTKLPRLREITCVKNQCLKMKCWVIIASCICCSTHQTKSMATKPATQHKEEAMLT